MKFEILLFGHTRHRLLRLAHQFAQIETRVREGVFKGVFTAQTGLNAK